MLKILSETADVKRYDEWIKRHPQGNLWQSIEREHYHRARGKETKIYALEQDDRICGSALVLIDKTAFGFSTWDIARGPLIDALLAAHDAQTAIDALLERVVRDAKQARCLALYLSPSFDRIDNQVLLTAQSSKLKASSRHIHAQATILIDLQQSEDQILAQMHSKGRYNIRLAQKHGITVQRSEDIDSYFRLAQKTGQRNAFTIQSKALYRAFLEHQSGSFLLLAMKDDEPIAGLTGVIWNGMGIYYYGASDHTQRALMAPYVLQWEAMKLCKAAGCHTYDLLGIDPPGVQTAWAGITEFKKKFGGRVVEYAAEQELVLEPGIKWLLEMKRKIIQ